MNSRKDTTYNGWRNRATWNCALWMDNDYGLYQSAVSFTKSWVAKRGKKGGVYAAFIRAQGMDSEKTGDGFKWLSRDLDYRALNENMFEMVS